ncbi:MAG: M23 family metallopeptidase [Clostridia bacterium]|nr:M23 family metallopeptidase [Clostridia bacterium]
MYIILKRKIKYYTKEMCKLFSIMAVALGLITAIILLKYKPTYKVTLSGQEIGYVESGTEFDNRIQQEVIGMEGKNIDFVSLDEMPNYELKLVSREQETNEEEIIIALKENAKIMYKYYAVILNNETIGLVDNIEEAQESVNEIKEENKNKTIKLDLAITENYTEDINSVTLESVQVAQAKIEQKVAKLIKIDQKTKKPIVNGILLAVTPVQGRITSRFGHVSGIRSGAHTGTDIACPQGTPIKAVNSGTVTFAGWNGSYGNLIKVSHGNGVETWYAHCTELYGTVGQQVNAGDVIATVGSTGNSTGNHLHLEVRLNGKALNPQNYLYK